MPLAIVVPVRDEADIIADMLRFHFFHGVNFAVVLDNGSVDGTADILADMAREYPIHLIHDPRHENQHAEWGNRMVALAKEKGATWVIAADADEFWWTDTGHYQNEAGPHNVIRTRWHNLLPNWLPWKDLRTVGDFAGRQYESWMPKVAFTTANFSGLEQGFHNVSIWNRCEVESSHIRVYHYPIRSYEQFEKKVVNGGSSYEKNAAAQSSQGMGQHTRAWYEAYKQGRLREVFQQIILAPHANARRDDTMFNYWHPSLEVTL